MSLSIMYHPRDLDDILVHEMTPHITKIKGKLHFGLTNSTSQLVNIEQNVLPKYKENDKLLQFYLNYNVWMQLFF